MATFTVGGNFTKAASRQEQIRKFEEDKRKFKDKEQAKEKKKKEEKWKRYSHIDMGQRLGSSSGNDVENVRSTQQTEYSVNSLEAYDRNRQMENERLKREQEKRKQMLRRHDNVVGGSGYAATSQQDNERELQSERDREEAYKQEMRLARERLQKKYDSAVRNSNKD